MFAPVAGNSRITTPFVFRAYAQTNTLLATAVTNDHFYFLALGGAPRDLGALSNFVDVSGCR